MLSNGLVTLMPGREAIRKLNELREREDHEMAYLILFNFLHRAGYGAVADAWDEACDRCGFGCR